MIRSAAHKQTPVLTNTDIGLAIRRNNGDLVDILLNQGGDHANPETAKWVGLNCLKHRYLTGLRDLRVSAITAA